MSHLNEHRLFKGRKSEEIRRIKESNEPGLNVFNDEGIDKKLNNLLGFDDFDSI